MLTKFFKKRGADTDAVEIRSPLTGSVIPLANVPDEAFAGMHMGAGIAIMPADGKLIAPFDGTVAHLIYTHHAIVIEHPSGLQLLIHLGINTVALNGECFNVHVQTGDAFLEGQTLIEFDSAAIAEAGFSIVCPIVIANEEEVKQLDIVVESQDYVTAGRDSLLSAVMNI
ncbi:PTS sugar transporter subunit IIA [Paenibacillus radicis (ex Gao et al. 2016)]|uniref:PTS EIIA type-1 domain-containing protein n=1 Tax=Paenibacillus radicis (ex Gao et al. 2016) TaxID=1737354 RepID=A0A917GM60_9BACL|nr:PTS glucose transporter subunit IIA [Paenibacillus radicis (ex Gao et al. 2016)]GGG51760.1 hypothetical protein GCM10010918_00570 [Paenibacillus radicis (ex Gao et al. 2016)]